MVMGKDNASIGKASLWISRAGMSLPALLIFLVRIFPWSETVWVYTLCGGLLVFLELVALGCGIAGRRTIDGIAGQAMSVAALLLFAVYVVVFLTVLSP
jgi:hypothetical protein